LPTCLVHPSRDLLRKNRQPTGPVRFRVILDEMRVRAIRTSARSPDALERFVNLSREVFSKEAMLGQ
jgi:hypothetical protein